ncbi:MAG: glycosyltransferase [Candidatus Eremiobacteraeota bacterium]|nr:glycosyltransferase [Candidatus Eremiobacteraeota bacterium]
MERLRIGFFTEIYRPVVNGVVASVDALADGLRRRGHEVYCFAPHIPGYPEPDGPVFRMPSLPLPIRTPYRLTLPLVSRRNLNRVIKRLSLVHVHSPFVTGWMGLRYARRYGMPLVFTYHTQLEAYAHYVPFDAHATRFAVSHLTRAFANRADAVVVPTPAMAAHLRRLGVTARIETVPSGIDVAHFGAGQRDDGLRTRLGARSGSRLLLYVGRLGKEKNVELLLRALARANDDSLRLIIAGEGPQRDKLHRETAELRIGGAVRFLGLVSRERLPDLYASADAFLMPSTTETQGLVLAEALAAGAAVIAADAPQNREVLGGAGVVIPGTPEAFAAAFRSLGDATPGSSARARAAASRFGIDRHAESIESLYRSLTPAARIA